MSGVHTETVGSVHAYTRSDVPWEAAEKGVMWAHGQNVRQMEESRRQRRFAVVAAVFGIVWLILYLV